jgi:hypothetical protein
VRDTDLRRIEDLVKRIAASPDVDLAGASAVVASQPEDVPIGRLARVRPGSIASLAVDCRALFDLLEEMTRRFTVRGAGEADPGAAARARVRSGLDNLATFTKVVAG